MPAPFGSMIPEIRPVLVLMLSPGGRPAALQVAVGSVLATVRLTMSPALLVWLPGLWMGRTVGKVMLKDAGAEVRVRPARPLPSGTVTVTFTLPGLTRRVI